MTKQSLLPTPIIDSLKNDSGTDNKLISAMGQLKLFMIRHLPREIHSPNKVQRKGKERPALNEVLQYLRPMIVWRLD